MSRVLEFCQSFSKILCELSGSDFGIGDFYCASVEYSHVQFFFVV